MKVRFTPRAVKDLNGIFAHVAAHNPAAAARLVESIEASINTLRDFPNLGHPTQPAGRLVLTLPDAPYRVFYRLAAQEVRILNIRHTSRRPPRGHS
ncbi:MAG TPA: type II toxin-antitoxin system RelE/ParE family toxin [Microvirga sp.]|jgi:plasmid stabilization system protein ParE|nr:type II toxin-antitoxin system RelE/ParE family toxin [Microvirga sp.]